MAAGFNVEEVFQIAINIEVNGEKFYRRAAELAADGEVKKLFTELADWEKEHIRVFSDMRDSLIQIDVDEFIWEPNGEVEKYLAMVAGGYVFTSEESLITTAENCSTVTETLQFALNREKDAVLFYASLEDVVPEKFGGNKIKAITKEEISHVRMLTEKIVALGE